MHFLYVFILQLLYNSTCFKLVMIHTTHNVKLYKECFHSVNRDKLKPQQKPSLLNITACLKFKLNKTKINYETFVFQTTNVIFS